MCRLLIGFQIFVASFSCFSQTPSVENIFGENLAQLNGWTLDSIIWDEVYDDGSKLAILEGPRNIPGKKFTYAFFLPDGIMVPSHWHCAEARVFVAQGTMLLGLGKKADSSKVSEYPVGSYLIVPHRVAHYEAAKGDLIIFGTGIGPWCSVDTE